MNLWHLQLFLCGWGFGFLLEYALHWIMHRFTLGFHIHHHREFFYETPRVVALHTIDPRLDLKFFAAALLLLLPLSYWVDWRSIMALWGGCFWHIVIFYELCHALIHDSTWLPDFILRTRIFRWWRGCHIEHHFHAPTKNYSVTLPLLDRLLGTYAAPRANYPDLPHPKLQPKDNEGYKLERTES